MSAPVAIVLPVFNAKFMLAACVHAAVSKAGSTPFDLIFVDGGSTDGTKEWIREYAGRNSNARLLCATKRGVAHALNLAIAEAPGRDIVRLHSDVVIETDGWLDLLRSAAHAQKRAGVTGVKLVYPDDKIHSVGRRIISGVGINARHSNLHEYEPDSAKFGTALRETDTVPGALCYIRHEVPGATGGFDEAFAPQYLDDDDFCLMARFHDWKVFVHPGVKAVHHTPNIGPSTRIYIRDNENNTRKIVEAKKAIISSHLDYWHQKWGFHPVHPDLGEIRRLYGRTEVCWRVGDAMAFKPREWPPAVDVVLITWNNKKVLQRCLESVAATRYKKVHVHVVDNASTDGTIQYLDSLAATFPFPLTVHKMAVNTGVPVGFNWGIVNGSAEVVARIDDDVIVPPEWLEVLVEDLKQRPYAGVVGPKILNDNGQHDIQCGPYRLYPYVYGHDNEPDLGQADYISKCVHVRGCCNVYRRDVFEKAGWFDLRFSPSQVDDPEHHIALGVAGFEVLYDGRVGVVHMQTAGAARGYAASSNLAANNAKLAGKWGGDIWRVLDTAIDLSREGRFLPDHLDTKEFESRLPDRASFPRPFTPEENVTTEAATSAAARLRSLLTKPGGAMKEYFDDMLGQARSLARDQRMNEAAEVLQSLLDLAPYRYDALADLAATLLQMGQPARAQLALRRAAALCVERPAFKESLDTMQKAIDSHATGKDVATGASGLSPADRSSEIGEGAGRNIQIKGGGPRVLILNSFERRTPGGDMMQIRKTREHLIKLGCTVDVSYSPRPDPRGYDIIHVYNLWFPAQTLPQVKAIRLARPDVPIVMTPIYWNMTEKSWADAAVPELFASSRNEKELQFRLQSLADGSLTIGGSRRGAAPEPNFSGYEEYQCQILDLVDHLLPQSKLEVQNLAATLGRKLPFTLTTNAAEPDIFDRTDAGWFVENYGVKDFVITVGLVENRKNQLMLLHALKQLDIPAVVIGRNYDRNYLRLCREHASPRTIFLEHLPHEQLASALKAARVFALPSWMECASFAAIEAALAGCQMVVSDRTSEPEYFKDCAYYCDPADISSIKTAVLNAWNNHEADVQKRARLREEFVTERNWQRCAEQTLTGYRAAMELRQKPWHFPDAAPLKAGHPAPAELTALQAGC